jgi:hypothetical protein
VGPIATPRDPLKQAIFGRFRHRLLAWPAPSR